MDSNNFVHNAGVGEREARIYSCKDICLSFLVFLIFRAPADANASNILFFISSGSEAPF